MTLRTGDRSEALGSTGTTGTLLGIGVEEDMFIRSDEGGQIMWRTTASSSGLASTGQSTTVVAAPRRTTTIRFDRPISSSSDSDRNRIAAPPAASERIVA